MKKLTVKHSVIAIGLMCLASMPVKAQFAVIDAGAIAEAVTQTGKLEDQIKKMMEQIEQLKKTNDQLKKTHDSLNGMRDASSLLKDDLLKQAVPLDFKKLQDAMEGKGGASISGKMNEFTQKNQQTSCEKTAKTAADQKSCKDNWSMLSSQHAMGQSGYESAYKNLENLQKMLDGIKKSKDPKEIADVQARLQLEQIKAQNENNKMQAYQMVLNAKKEAAQNEQKNQIQSGAGKRLFN